MVPEKEVMILQTTVPESMVVSMQTASDGDLAKFQVIGIGPGTHLLKRPTYWNWFLANNPAKWSWMQML